MSTPRWPRLAALALAATVLASCSAQTAGGEDAGSTEPVRVLMINSLSGPLSTSGSAQRDGLTAAVDSINEAGGIEGRTVELTVLDDQLDPTVAATLLQQEFDKGTPDLVYHPFASSIALAILPAIQREKVISLSCAQSSAINDPESFPYAFGIVPSAALETESMLAYLEDAGVESIGLLTANDATGQDYVANFGTALDDAGIEWNAESYAQTDIDMTAQLGRLAANDPDMIITQGHGAAAGYYLKSRTRLGIDTPTLGASGIANGTNLGAITGPEDWTNLELMSFPVNTPDYAPATERAAWEDLFSRLDTIDATAVSYTCGWDVLQLYKRAVEQAGDFDSDAVKAALEDLEEVPADEMLSLSFERVEYSPESHFPVLEPGEAYVLTAPGPLVDGVVTPPAE